MSSTKNNDNNKRARQSTNSVIADVLDIQDNLVNLVLKEGFHIQQIQTPTILTFYVNATTSQV